MRREQATVDSTSTVDDGVVLARADGTRVRASADAVARGGWRFLRPGQRVVVVTDTSGHVVSVEPLPA